MVILHHVIKLQFALQGVNCFAIGIELRIAGGEGSCGGLGVGVGVLHFLDYYPLNGDLK
jgi:hypothetical protein